MSRTVSLAAAAFLVVASGATARAEGFNTKHLFVTDEANPLVAEIDEEGHLFNIFTLVDIPLSDPTIGSSSTQGVVMSPKGTMLVVRGRNTIVQVKPNGTKKIGMAPTPTFPSYITVGPQGHLYASGDDGVHVYSIVDNPVNPALQVTEINVIGEKQLVPAGLGFGPDGLLYVADNATGTVQRFTPDGMSMGSIGEFSTPEGLAFLPDGSLLVADSETDSIEHLDSATGNSIESFSDVALNEPRGLAVTQLGTVMVCATSSDKVLSLDIDTGVFSLFSFEVSNPFAAAVAPQRFKVTISGKMRVADQTPAQTLQNEPGVIAIDPATGNAVLDLKGDATSPPPDFAAGVGAAQSVLGQDMFTFNGFISYADTSMHRQMRSIETAQAGPTAGGADLTMNLRGTPGPFRFSVKGGAGQLNVYGPGRVGNFVIRLKEKLN